MKIQKQSMIPEIDGFCGAYYPCPKPLVFRAGMQYPAECKAVREDIDKRLRDIISEL